MFYSIDHEAQDYNNTPLPVSQDEDKDENVTTTSVDKDVFQIDTVTPGLYGDETSKTGKIEEYLETQICRTDVLGKISS